MRHNSHESGKWLICDSARAQMKPNPSREYKGWKKYIDVFAIKCPSILLLLRKKVKETPAGLSSSLSESLQDQDQETPLNGLESSTFLWERCCLFVLDH
jgi:hypothetical protein